MKQTILAFAFYTVGLFLFGSGGIFVAARIIIEGASAGEATIQLAKAAAFASIYIYIGVWLQTRRKS